MYIEKITSTEEYLDLITRLLRTGHILRGMSAEYYELIPAFGRKEYLETYSIKAEKHLLRLFKQRDMAFIRHKPDSSLEWLALGQYPVSDYCGFSTPFRSKLINLPH
ncbi:MAG: FRG domain-containing protein [Candidatus Thiodiazotropha sp. DIVDIV]